MGEWFGMGPMVVKNYKDVGPLSIFLHFQTFTCYNETMRKILNTGRNDIKRPITWVLGFKCDKMHWLFGFGMYIETGPQWRMSIFEGGHILMPGVTLSRNTLDLRFLGNACMYQRRQGFKCRMVWGQHVPLDIGIQDKL